MLNPGPGERGAATVEFYLVALLAMMPLCLGMLQTSLLLISNHHVKHAAFMAARAGANHQGDIAVMRREFARVVTPLFVQSTGRLDSGNVVARVSAAQLRATADVAAFSRISVLSPSVEAQHDFGQVRDGVNVIPSDSLQYRSHSQGQRSGISLQQANMLRVEFTYCSPLVVPFVRGLLTGLLRQLDNAPTNLRCYANGRVPLRAVGAAPMQSDFRIAADAG
jgi:TadE-like protein